MTSDEQLDRLVQVVLQSAKYRSIGPEIIRAVGRRELAARRSLKEAVKATKNKLHQIAGAYIDEQPRYDTWLAELTAAARPQTEPLPASDDPVGRYSAGFRAACLRVMQAHASTRERVPILDRFYATTMAAIQPVRSVMDLACGLNPLTLPWMPLANDPLYYACDLYADMMAFVQSFLSIAGVQGTAHVCDLVAGPPREQVDLALALKVLPPLEQVDKTAGIRLLRAINARHILVSFPAQSLGGRDRRMPANYERHFWTLIASESWPVQRFAFPSELVFLISKA